MKTIKTFILTLFSSFFLFSQNTGIEVIYSKALKKFDDTSKEEPKVLRGLEYNLKCNANESIFKFIDLIFDETIKGNERFIGRGGGKGIYYRNINENLRIREVENDNKVYHISIDTNKYNWVLHKDEKKTILGYECFKATGSFKELNLFNKIEKEHNVVVWYTPSIPVPFGPADYFGLPGLVLESKQDSFYFIATNIKFIDKIDISTLNIKDKKLISEVEYNEVLFSNIMKLKD